MISIGVKYDGIILDIKKSIEDNEGIPVDHQILIFEGQELDDTEMTEKYWIKSQSTLHLKLTPDLIPITLQVNVIIPRKKNKLISIEDTCTIKNLKAKIAEQSDVDEFIIMIHLADPKSTITDDKTMKDLGVKDGDTIKLLTINPGT